MYFNNVLRNNEHKMCLKLSSSNGFDLFLALMFHILKKKQLRFR